MEWFVDQPIATQTAFAQLQQTALQTLSARTLGMAKGSFSSRAVKGKTYWYYQFHNKIAGRQQQIYLGPDSKQIRSLVQQKETEAPGASVLLDSIRRQARIASAAGAITTPTYHLKLIQQLEEYGFFHAGGILVGTHAFGAYANMLGIRWNNDGVASTLDVDFAHAGRSLSIALPSSINVKVKDAIESLGEGFVPLTGNAASSGSWVHPQDKDYVIDFLTPQTSTDNKPIEEPRLGVALQPLRFMEFSLEGVDQTVLFDRSSAVVVGVPDPARYAIHKLIVYGERKGTHRIKAKKDLKQAAALSAVLSRDRPDDLRDAWNDAQSRGPGWRRRLNEGVEALLTAYPDSPLLSCVQANEQPPPSSRPRWLF